MYDVACKLLDGIKSMYDNSLTCFRVKEGVRGSVLGSMWCETGVYHVPLALQCLLLFLGNWVGGPAPCLFFF